jgi:hypothetical protein
LQFDSVSHMFVKTTKHAPPDRPDDSSDMSEAVDNIKGIMGKCKALAKSIKAIPYSQWLAVSFSTHFH